MPVLELRPEGLYCEAGDFFVDPWKPVPRAVVTHGHADHARPGNGVVVATDESAPILQRRLSTTPLETLRYGERRTIGTATVSLHPAGHVRGSAQVRVEVGGEVWVVSGDFKRAPDPTCAPFEPVRCHVFITESTFGLPIYRWPTVSTLEGELRAFWQRARNEERAAVIFAYALGKSQRILAHLKDEEGPFVVHGAVEKLVEAYRAAGVDLPKTTSVTDLVAAEGKGALKRALVLAPPSAQGTPWMRRFGHPLRGLASGWMAVRGTRRRKALDRGFVLSDHADWPALLSAIDDTGASRVLVTHGHVEPLVRYLNDRGLDAAALATPWAGEQGSEDEGSGLDALDAEEAHVQASAP